MLHYVVCDYMATGEGLTRCLLITMAYPKQEDYKESNSHMNPDGSFHFEMPELKPHITPKLIAMREFKEEFGAHYAIGAEYISEEKFKEKWLKHCPPYFDKLIADQSDSTKAAGNIYYAQKLHVNYS